MSLELFSLFAKIGLDTGDFDKGIKDSKKSMADYKSDVMKLAQEYKKQGMSMSDAMKKAYAEIDKSQYDTAETSKQTAASFSANWGNAAESVKSSLSGAASALGSALSAIGQAAAVGLGAASAAAVAFGTDAVNVGKQFDAAMANVASISGATGDALNDLREKAIEMGGSTKFSATEAADAMGYMAMAGWKTEEMLDGISGIMNLAAASGESLARTSDIVTDALTAFGLTAADAGHFADVLAVASSAANTNVSLMGETFKYVAPIIGTLYGQGELAAEGMEDAAVAIGLMANAGIKASQAGTALRSGLTRLTKPTDDMIATMKQLGLAVSEISAEEAEAQTKALEQSLKAKQKAYEDDYDALKESLEKQSDALRKSLESRYDAQKEAFDAEYDALKKTLDKRYDAQKEAFDAEYDETKKAYDKSYEAAKDIYEKQYDERKKSLDANYDALEAELDAEIDATEKAQEQTLAEVQKSQEEQVKAYQEATDAKLAFIDEEYRESLKNIDRDEYERLKALDDQIAAIQELSDKDKKEAEKSERARKKAELQKAIDAADSAEKRLEAEQKLADYNEKIRLQDVEAERKAQIAKLKADKDAVKEEIKADKEAAKEKRDADTKAYKRERAAGLEDLKETNKQNLATLKEGQKADLEALKDSKKEQLAALKESNAADLKEMKDLQAEQLASIKELNESQLADLKKSHSDQLAALKEDNQAQLQESKKGHSEKLTALKEANEERLAEVKKTNAKELKALQESNKDKLAEYQEYVKEQKKAIKAAAESAQSIVLTDENGNMRELLNSDKEHLGVINLLRDAFAGLSEVEQAEAASTLFGQEAMSGWLAILNADSDTIADLESGVKSASDVIDGYNGMAEKMAAVHEDSLAGSITTLGSALETLKIRISDEITPALRTFTEFAQNSVVALTQAFEKGGFAGMMDALGPVIEDGIGMLMGYIPQVVEVGGQLLGAVVTGIIHNLPVLAEGALTLATSFGGYLLDAFREVFGGWGLGEEFDAVVTSVSETFEKVRDAVTGAFERIKTAFSDAFGEYFTSGQAAQDITNLLTGAIELFGDAVSVAADFVATAAEKIIDFVKWLSEGSTGADLFTAAVAGVVAAFVAFKAALAINTLIGTFKKAIDGAKLAFAGFNAIMAANPLILVATLIAGVVTALIVLWNTNEDFRNAVKGIWEDIKQIFSNAWEFIKGVWEAAKPFFEWIWAGIESTFKVAEAVLGGFFSTAWAAITLVWDAVTGYFQNIWNTVSGIFSVVERVFHGDFKGAYDAIKDIFKGWGDYWGGLWDDLTNVFGNAFDWFADVGKNIVDGLKAGIGGLWDGFLTFIGLKTDEVKEEVTGPEGIDAHSPSRWARKVFRSIPEGGILGIADGMPKLLSGASDAVRDIQNALAADPLNVSGGYQLSGGYTAYHAPQLAAAGAGYGGTAAPQPITLVLNNVNEIGGEKVERKQRKFRVNEDARVGASLVKL